MYTGELGAITFRTVFQKVQSLVGKTKKVADTASAVVAKYTPPAAPAALPAEIPASSAVEYSMSTPPRVNWFLVGGIAVGGLALMKFLKRRK